MAEISEKLGVTPNAIWTRLYSARKLGFLEELSEASRKAPATEGSRTDEMLDLYESGLSPKEVAARLGVSAKQVNAAVYRARRAGRLLPTSASASAATEAKAWERMRLELAEQHRQEFLAGIRVVPWARDSDAWGDE